MQDQNSLNIVGRLTKDAELKYTAAGTPVASFSIAVNRSVKKGDQWEDEASFFECVFFGALAEAVSKYLLKAKQVAITGSLKQDRWQGSDGSNHSKVKIIVDQLQLFKGVNDAV